MPATLQLMDMLDLAAVESPTPPFRVGVAFQKAEADQIVWRKGDDVLEQLDLAVEAGAVPIGLVRITEDPVTGKLVVDSQVFNELRGDNHTRAVLSRISQSAGTALVKELREEGYGAHVTYRKGQHNHE
jgi:hypothetical protein